MGSRRASHDNLVHERGRMLSPGLRRQGSNVPRDRAALNPILPGVSRCMRWHLAHARHRVQVAVPACPPLRRLGSAHRQGRGSARRRVRRRGTSSPHRPRSQHRGSKSRPLRSCSELSHPSPGSRPAPETPSLCHFRPNCTVTSPTYHPVSLPDSRRALSGALAVTV